MQTHRSSPSCPAQISVSFELVPTQTRRSTLDARPSKRNHQQRTIVCTTFAVFCLPSTLSSAVHLVAPCFSDRESSTIVTLRLRRRRNTHPTTAVAVATGSEAFGSRQHCIIGGRRTESTSRTCAAHICWPSGPTKWSRNRGLPMATCPRPGYPLAVCPEQEKKPIPRNRTRQKNRTSKTA